MSRFPIRLNFSRPMLLGLLGLAVLAHWMGGSRAEAQGGPGAAGRPARRVLKPGEVDLQLSRVYVFVGKTGLGHDHGIEGLLRAGELQVGAERNAGRLEFDLRSFTADTAAARTYVGLAGQTDRKTADKVTANMLGPAVLDVARFPTALFEATAITPLPRQGNQPQQYQLTGDFTLHGVKRQIQFPAQAETAQGLLHLRGSFAIRQTDFQITPYSQAFGAVGVADQLTIYGDLWLGVDPGAGGPRAAPSTPVTSRPEAQPASGPRRQ
ncbi:MAG: YceI family protein [Planctomycetaceae bacterium]